MKKFNFTICLLQFVFLASSVLSQGNKVLTLTAHIEGFYDKNTNITTGDTIQVYLREDDSPYQLKDSAKAFMNSSGVGIFNFSNTPNLSDFRIVVKHRNSIETWGLEAFFENDTLSINLSTFASQAYGNNLKLKGEKYCIFGGDVDQDETVGLSDLSLIDNDVTNFAAGYLPTDLNGDEIIDMSDMAIAGNNASDFVSVVKPPYVNFNAPTITIENATLNGEPAPWITGWHFMSLPVGVVLECDIISTDPDFNERLWDTCYVSMRDFWLPFELDATLIFTPSLRNVGPSPLVTHVYLQFHQHFIGYIKWASYDKGHTHESYSVLFFNY